MRRAVIDDRLGIRVVSRRELVYSSPARAGDDRPPHVRAASGLAWLDDALYVIQDDASFIARIREHEVIRDATITRELEIDAIALPHAPGGRRRFEESLGNRLDKLDLEACVMIDGTLWAFGSGALPVREVVVKLTREGPTLIAAGELYRALREAFGSPANIEGSVRVRDELWFCHRGNTGPRDAGPAIARVKVAAFRHFIEDGKPPRVVGVERYDLGTVDGARVGFTDAATRGDRVVFVAAAEASADAIADGQLRASRIGVIAGDEVRMNELAIDGQLRKAEGIALDHDRIGTGWLTIDPDDPATPTVLFEIELTGSWW